MTCTRRQIPVRCQPSPDPRLNQTVCMWCRKPLPTEPGPVLRDPVFERDWLVHCEHIAGMDSGWKDAVADRLYRMEREKGPDSFRDLGLRRIVAEASEETLDLGGWPLMGTLLSRVELADDPELGHAVRMKLQELATLGPLGLRICQQIVDLLSEAA